MDEIRITIGYKTKDGQLLRSSSVLPMSSYYNDKEILEYLARNTAKSFSQELDIELENLRYAPKKYTTDTKFFNTMTPTINHPDYEGF